MTNRIWTPGELRALSPISDSEARGESRCALNIRPPSVEHMHRLRSQWSGGCVTSCTDSSYSNMAPILSPCGAQRNVWMLHKAEHDQTTALYGAADRAWACSSDRTLTRPWQPPGENINWRRTRPQTCQPWRIQQIGWGTESRSIGGWVVLTVDCTSTYHSQHVVRPSIEREKKKDGDNNDNSARYIRATVPRSAATNVAEITRVSFIIKIVTNKTTKTWQALQLTKLRRVFSALDVVVD